MKHSSTVRKSKAFTIIELLVVVSIISMLSSVILVSVQNARDKGRVGGGIRFATNNYRGFGDKMSVYFDFNEASGNATDKSDGKVVGILTKVGAGTIPYRISSSYSTVAGSALHFEAGSTPNFGYIRTSGGNAYFNLPTSGAVSFWIQVSPNASSDNVILYDGNSATFVSILSSAAGSHPDEIDISDKGIHLYSQKKVTDGLWHNITWTSPTTGSQKLYVDGSLVDDEVFSGSRISRNFYYIGYSGTGGLFDANLDDLMVFQQNLAENEVRQIYTQGRLTHPLADAK